jgi:hypothetical protein
MDPRPLLRVLIERLEPEVGHISMADFSYWGDAPPPGLQAHIVSGRLHLARALLLAKEALASDNDEEIVTASLMCPTFERTGREIARKHADDLRSVNEKSRRVAGGSTRGHQQRIASQEFWAPWQAEFQARLPSAGQAKARATVTKDIRAAGHTISDSAARKWLSEKKVATQL